MKPFCLFYSWQTQLCCSVHTQGHIRPSRLMSFIKTNKWIHWRRIIISLIKKQAIIFNNVRNRISTARWVMTRSIISRWSLFFALTPAQKGEAFLQFWLTFAHRQSIPCDSVDRMGFSFNLPLLLAPYTRRAEAWTLAKKTTTCPFCPIFRHSSFASLLPVPTIVSQRNFPHTFLG